MSNLKKNQVVVGFAKTPHPLTDLVDCVHKWVYNEEMAQLLGYVTLTNSSISLGWGYFYWGNVSDPHLG